MKNRDFKILSWSITSNQFPNESVETDEDVLIFMEKLLELPEDQQKILIKTAEKLIKGS